MECQRMMLQERVKVLPTHLSSYITFIYEFLFYLARQHFHCVRVFIQVNTLIVIV